MSSLSLVIHQMNAKGRSGVIVDKDKVSWGSEAVASVLNLDTNSMEKYDYRRRTLRSRSD